MYCALALVGAQTALGAESARPSLPELQRQVENTERAFAKTMADRDYTAFTSFLSDEAVFFSGQTPARGKLQVAQAWKRFYEKSAAPFSWAPETVAVLDSGTLALSTGPVRDAQGKLIGTFMSIRAIGASFSTKVATPARHAANDMWSRTAVRSRCNPGCIAAVSVSSTRCSGTCRQRAQAWCTQSERAVVSA